MRKLYKFLLQTAHQTLVIVAQRLVSSEGTLASCFRTSLYIYIHILNMKIAIFQFQSAIIVSRSRFDRTAASKANQVMLRGPPGGRPLAGLCYLLLEPSHFGSFWKCLTHIIKILLLSRNKTIICSWKWWHASNKVFTTVAISEKVCVRVNKNVCFVCKDSRGVTNRKVPDAQTLWEQQGDVSHVTNVELANHRRRSCEASVSVLPLIYK